MPSVVRGAGVFENDRHVARHACRCQVRRVQLARPWSSLPAYHPRRLLERCRGRRGGRPQYGDASVNATPGVVLVVSRQIDAEHPDATGRVRGRSWIFSCRAERRDHLPPSPVPPGKLSSSTPRQPSPTLLVVRGDPGERVLIRLPVHLRNGVRSRPPSRFSLLGAWACCGPSRERHADAVGWPGHRVWGGGGGRRPSSTWRTSYAGARRTPALGSRSPGPPDGGPLSASLEVGVQVVYATFIVVAGVRVRSSFQ